MFGRLSAPNVCRLLPRTPPLPLLSVFVPELPRLIAALSRHADYDPSSRRRRRRLPTAAQPSSDVADLGGARAQS